MGFRIAEVARRNRVAEKMKSYLTLLPHSCVSVRESVTFGWK